MVAEQPGVGCGAVAAKRVDQIVARATKARRAATLVDIRLARHPLVSRLAQAPEAVVVIQALPAVETGPAGTLVNVHLAPPARESRLAFALVPVDLVDALGLVLAGV